MNKNKNKLLKELSKMFDVDEEIICIKLDVLSKQIKNEDIKDVKVKRRIFNSLKKSKLLDFFYLVFGLCGLSVLILGSSYLLFISIKP